MSESTTVQSVQQSLARTGPTGVHSVATLGVTGDFCKSTSLEGWEARENVVVQLVNGK